MVDRIDYRRVLDGFADAVVVADATHRILYLNRAAERLLGWTADELVEQPVTTIVPVRLHPSHREGFKRYQATHEPRILGQPLRVPALRRDGSEVEIELHLNAVAWDGEELIVASLRSPRERVELERQLSVTRYLRATTAAAARLVTRLDQEQVLETVVDTLVNDFDATLARVWLYEPEANLLVLKASAGLSRRTVESPRARISIDSYPYKVGEVARTRKPFLKNGLVGDPQFEQDWVAREGIASTAVFPLLSGHRLKGVLCYFSRRPLHDEVVEALTAFISLVSTSLDDVDLFAAEQAARVEAETQRQILQTILDVLPVGVLLADAQTERVTVINPAAREIWGKNTPSCAISEMSSIFPVSRADDSDLTAEEQPLSQALRRQERVRELVRYHHPDGQERILDVLAAPMPGSIGGAVATYRDVTARVRMELELAERANQLKALLDHLPVGVAYFDNQCVCRASNGPALRILGRSRSEITGLSAAELFAQAPSLQGAVELCVRSQTPHAEQSTPWPDPAESGETRFLDWRFEPLPSSTGRSAGALALIVDVTERKRAEDGLKIAKEAAELSARNKTRFLSAVSHDLRTPVNALSLLAELLIHTVGQRGENGELREVAEDIRLSAANLIELINDLLDLARFDSGDIAHHPTNFRLDEWLQATLEPLQLTAQAKKLDLSWSVDQPGRVVYADRVKMSRVLTNLVGNAVKFTETGRVSVRAEVTPAGWLSVAVQDTGPGIPADQQERIFDEFAQLRNPERDRTKGTGLGLAICKRLVESVGGKVSLRSRPGSGSTFTTLFPPDHLEPSESASLPSAASEPAPALARAPLLLVEDDTRSLQALSRLLANVGYNVEMASQGAEALEIVNRVRPALVLLDLMLPGMDGMEVLRRMRGMPSWGNPPVILLSGDVLRLDHGLLRTLGVADVVAKPVDFDALLAIIARHVRSESRPA